MNHLSLSLWRSCLSSSLTLSYPADHPSPIIYFSHIIPVCLPLSPCRRTDATQTYCICSEWGQSWRGRRRRFSSASYFIPTSLWPTSNPAKHNICFNLTFFEVWNIAICRSGHTFALMGQYFTAWVKVFLSFGVNHMRKACSGTDPAPKCLYCNWHFFLAREKDVNLSTVTAVIV